jgi:DNA polymerase-4
MVADEAKLRWLFLDLNSYFASVEQQARPELRGRPVIVVPVASDYTSAIAASLEAKALGIRTGMKVLDAKQICRDLAVIDARHDVYVEYHHRILDEIERHLHVTKVMSIDEVACELLGDERKPENALALARQVQAGVLKNVGACLRSSVGLAPSVLLAKTASDMKKPGGLTVLGMDQLPGPLLDLDLRDLSGIGRNMKARLVAAGVTDIAALWALSPNRMRAVWGSIMGERFCYGLHGIDPPDIATKPPQSIGHSHVLGHRLRNAGDAHLVGRRLLTRAASRLRRTGMTAGGLSLYLRMTDEPSRDAALRFDLTADTFHLLRIYEDLWHATVRAGEACRPRLVGVTLFGLSVLGDIAPPDLFGWSAAATEDPKKLRLSAAMDKLNQRYGSETVAVGTVPRGLSRYMGAKIAFNRVPERGDFRG